MRSRVRGARKRAFLPWWKRARDTHPFCWGCKVKEFSPHAVQEAWRTLRAVSQRAVSPASSKAAPATFPLSPFVLLPDDLVTCK